MLLLFCLADSCAQDQPKFSLIGIATGTVDFKAGNLQQTVGLGVWTRYGGLMIMGKQFPEDLRVNETTIPAITKKLMIGYYGRIVLARRFMFSPYGAIGKGYSEAGMQVMYLINPEVMAGFSAGSSKRAGNMIGLSFMLNFSN